VIQMETGQRQSGLQAARQRIQNSRIIGDTARVCALDTDVIMASKGMIA